jgi:hypothetical protein
MQIWDLLAATGRSRSLTGVVSASSIGAAKGGGYARYLEAKTIAPERGDYYLTPDGELTQSPGRWLADPETLDRLGIDPDSPVAGGDFISLMEGRHPGTGRFLRPEGAGGGRGGGIDVTFSAPKSVSTVWALAEPWQRHEIEAAHASAVEQTVGYMRATRRTVVSASCSPSSSTLSLPRSPTIRSARSRGRSTSPLR